MIALWLHMGCFGTINLQTGVWGCQRRVLDQTRTALGRGSPAGPGFKSPWRFFFLFLFFFAFLLLKAMVSYLKNNLNTLIVNWDIWLSSTGNMAGLGAVTLGGPGWCGTRSWIWGWILPHFTLKSMANPTVPSLLKLHQHQAWCHSSLCLPQLPQLHPWFTYCKNQTEFLTSESLLQQSCWCACWFYIFLTRFAWFQFFCTTLNAGC